MKKIKYIIFLVVTIIFIILLLLLIVNNNSKEGNDNYSIHEGEGELADIKENIQFSEYSVIKECIQKYIDLLDKNNSIYYQKQEDGTDKYNENIQKEMIYSVLNESFIKENNLNKDNILDKIQILPKKHIFYPNEIKVLNNSDIIVYKIHGILQDLEYISKKEGYYIVFVDKNGETFSIIPVDSKIYDSYTLNENAGKINNNVYNTYSLSMIQEEEIAIEYFEAYKFFTLANPKYTYDKMSEQYRNKRFGTYDNYVQYLKENYNEFKNIVPKRFLTNYNGEYTQYVIQDQNQNYYIFNASDILNYYVSLDNYTIDTEKFKITYENSNSQQKVQMNIDKFFQMINRQDYRTSYNVLDEQFKMNTLKGKDNFESIMKNKVFKYNIINFVEYKDLGSNTYSYKIKLTDLTKQNNNEINMTIIMKLKEGTDFVMSFSFK